MYRSILVPLDGSLASEQSLPYAAALARRSGAALQLVYVHTPLILGEGTMYLGTPDVQLWEEEKKYVLGVVNRLKKMGVEKVSAQVLEGPVAETLQEQALGEGCDLVVMTTHGRGAVSRFWLGSVADQLVHRLAIPLLLIRTREEARRQLRNRKSAIYSWPWTARRRRSKCSNRPERWRSCWGPPARCCGWCPPVRLMRKPSNLAGPTSVWCRRWGTR